MMWAAVDSNGIDMQPITNNNPCTCVRRLEARVISWSCRSCGRAAWVLLFIAFMILGGFFIMNLFVGVIIDNFNRLKETMGDSALLTPAQREWVKTRELMLHVRAVKLAERPRTYWRLQAWRITMVRQIWVAGAGCVCGRWSGRRCGG